MASNVYGTPITKEYMRETGRETSQKDRAKMALQMKNEDGKDVCARAFVERLVPRFGEKSVSTMCLIYNATGDPLTFYTDHNWIGRICESPYPPLIQNGQWGVFLHGQYYGGEEGSKAAIIYSGINSDENDTTYWVICFSSTPSGAYNQVYTEVCKSTDELNWTSLNDKLGSNDGNLVHMTDQNGGLMFGAMGNIKSCFCEAILTLPEALS